MLDYKEMYPNPNSDGNSDGKEPPKTPDPYSDPIGAFPEHPDWSRVQNTQPAAPEQNFPDPAAQQSAAPDPVPPPLQNTAPPPPQVPPRPSVPPQNQNTGAFFGDPNAPVGQTPDYGWQAPPVVPKEKPITMNRRIYTVCAVIAAMLFLLSVYCILSDVLHGALKGEELRPVTVNLQTQEKPELDPADDNVTDSGEYTVRGVADKVTPSIVEVYTYSDASRKDSSLTGTGSGIIISEDGYIITNAHVVQGASFKVTVGDDGDSQKEYNAELIGSDVKTDLAVLKVNAHGLTPAVLGDSSQTYVGENVVAIGNPAGLTNTVTKGIVSAIGRRVRAESSSFRMECIQTDAAISPGNSGGALVNMYGQVIGITSSKYASMYASTYEGLGFAITINEALPIITDLMEKGYVEGRFRIGIVLQSADTEAAAEEFREQYKTDMPEELKQSIWISEVSEDCDIHNTELKAGDFILSLNDTPIWDYDSTVEALVDCKGGDTVRAHCARYEDGKVRYFDIEFKLETDTSGNF